MSCKQPSPEPSGRRPAPPPSPPKPGCVQHDCAECRRRESARRAGGGDRNAYPQGSHSNGLTKRELFAAMAMQGLLANLAAVRAEGFRDEEIEEFAIMRADALIAALASTLTASSVREE